MPDHITKPEDKLSAATKVGYGTGMAAERLQMGGLNQMANPIFNDVLGIDPKLIGMALGITRVFDAITDPIMGYITDNTRTQFGRRRPWIALSSILCAVTFASIWMFPRGMSDTFYVFWFIITSVVFFTCLSVFSVPYLALGMEMTPDYHERTSVMAYRTAMAKLGGFMVSSLYLLTSLDIYDDMAEGMRYTGIGIGVLILLFTLSPVLFSKEHIRFFKGKHCARIKPKHGLMHSAKCTLRHGPFLILIGVTVVMLLGLTMVLQLGYYVTVYHVFDGSRTSETGIVLTLAGYSGQIGGLLGIPVMAYVSKRFGKRNTLLCAIAFSLIGTLLKWHCYTPNNPYLTLIPNFSMAFTLAAVWTLIHSMIPEIVDLDELETFERREGMFSAIYSWSVKMGMSLALIISGFILSSSGFEAQFGPDQLESAIFRMRIYYTLIPFAALTVGFVLMCFYPLTEKRSYAIRAQLEQRRK